MRRGQKSSRSAISFQTAHIYFMQCQYIVQVLGKNVCYSTSLVIRWTVSHLTMTFNCVLVWTFRPAHIVVRWHKDSSSGSLSMLWSITHQQHLLRVHLPLPLTTTLHSQLHTRMTQVLTAAWHQSGHIPTLSWVRLLLQLADWWKV